MFLSNEKEVTDKIFFLYQKMMLRNTAKKEEKLPDNSSRKMKGRGAWMFFFLFSNGNKKLLEDFKEEI